MKHHRKIERRAFIVLGMHRSGTSALMRVLNLVGVDIGNNLMGPAPNDNEKGFWEHMDIFRMNEKLLSDLNSSWDDVRPLPSGWWESEPAQRYRLGIVSILESDFGESRFWGVKDPRICRLLKVWHAILEQTDSRPYFLIIVRNPLEVVASLEKRNGFTVGKSCLLWLKHLLESEKETRGTRRVFLSYEELLADWKGLLSRVQRGFGFRWPKALRSATAEIEAFLEYSLRHNRVTDAALIKDKRLSRWLKDSYVAVLESVGADEDTELINTLVAVKAELKEAAILYEPVIDDVWKRYQSDHAVLEERNQRANEINERLERSIQERGSLLSDISHLEGGIKEKDERIQQLITEVGKLRVEVTAVQQTVVEREGKIAYLETGIKDRDDRIRKLDSQVENLTKELAESRKAGAAREAELRQLQTEVRERNERINELDSGTERLRKQFDLLQKHMENLRLSHQAIVDSTTWRASAPLRRLAGLVRKLESRAKFRAYVFSRSYRLLARSKLFDKSFYLEQNPDVAKSRMNPLVHYLKYGAGEGRDPNALFATSYYLEQNPDVARSGMNPLLHYLRHGADERRDPHPLFATSYYLEKNPDVAESGVSPVEHYIKSKNIGGGKPTPFLIRNDNNETTVASEEWPQVRVQCDRLTLSKNRIQVCGWALAEIELNRVEVYIEQHYVGDATYGLPRTDVADNYPTFANSHKAGFSLDKHLGSRELEHGKTYSVTIRANLKNGFTKEVEVPGTVAARMFVTCDNVDCIEEALVISGWALAEDGVEKVSIFVNGKFIGYAVYGHSRPDVENAYPDIIDSRRSGFSLFARVAPELRYEQTYIVLIRVESKGGFFNESTIQISSNYERYSQLLSSITPTSLALEKMKAASAKFSSRYHITVAIPVVNTTLARICCTLDSLGVQAYAYFDVALFQDGEDSNSLLRDVGRSRFEGDLHIHHISQLNGVLREAKGDYICFLHPGNTIMPTAFFEVIKFLNTGKAVDLVYADEDALYEGMRVAPFFKPDWSVDLFMSMNYIGNTFIVGKEAFVAAGGICPSGFPEAYYDLLLKVTEPSGAVGHVPLPLFSEGSGLVCDPDRSKGVLERALARRGIDAEVVPLKKVGSFRVRRKIIDDPKVSIIIPTAYYDAQRNVLACLRSIAEKSSYWNYEIIIIHNSFGRLSLSEIRRIVPESVPITEIEYNERFNYSTVNNIAARKATGDYFIFLNDDTEVIAPDWIEAMLEHAQRPEVGIVGAKLLYPDNTVQHAGMVLADKGGGARHIFCRFPFESEVHQNFLNVVRNSSVVTFACVMVPKRVYSLVGGLDENLRLECNDTDFCLRVRKAGLLVVWTPFALLYHKEISTRKETFVAEDVKFLWSRWEQTLRAGDPYYNPNLAVDCEIPAISKRFCQGV